MSNRLAGESSPYLLQHQNNPVNWFPWSAEALSLSKSKDRPIFLSIGYSACHWCHVMEHESFEDEEIAALLNEKFVCIKVDREERPDLDQIYMNAVQLMTGRGGWPMSVFLTPDLKPFYGGTYWPPQQRMGMPGFQQIILAVDDAWKNRREQALAQAGELTERIGQIGQSEEAGGDLPNDLLRSAVAKLEQMFDFTYGGFGSAPKFPHPMDLQVLLRYWRHTGKDGLLQMVRQTLDKMSQGGIYDHLGGGFARYSVDEKWLVPHFEKMLYDNALLAAAYLDGYLATGEQGYAQVVRETLDYVLRDMTDRQGAFYSTEDADSEGVEGKFYVWTVAEITEVLGTEQGERFCQVYDVTESGNFEGENILNLPKSIAQYAALHALDLSELEKELAESRGKLFAHRKGRIHPGKDDKVLVSWNGLMIDAMARAAALFQDPKYLSAAKRAARFILEEMTLENGRLLHCWRGGEAKLDAYLDDYACLINALVSLYETDFDERWIEEAVGLMEIVLKHFADESGGGFYFTADDHEELIARQKEMHDSSVPSSSAMIATALIRLGKLCGRSDYIEAARHVLQQASSVMQRAPQAAGQLLIAVDMLQGPLPEIVILGDPNDSETADILADLRRRYLPNHVVALRDFSGSDGSKLLDPMFAGKTAQSESLTVFVCQDFTCQAPVFGRAAVLQAWDKLDLG